MAEPVSPIDELRSQFQSLTEDLMEHLKLARDYATTPHNAWLSRTELNNAGNILAELETTLDRIKAEES